MKNFKVEPLNKIGDNERGCTWLFDNERTGELMMGYRVKGSLSGKHYHEGRSPQKSPEIFLLVHGEMEVYAKNLKTGEEIRERYTAPCRMEIGPYVWHEVVALTDISFIEFNSLQQHIDDTRYEKEIATEKMA